MKHTLAVAMILLPAVAWAQGLPPPTPSDVQTGSAQVIQGFVQREASLNAQIVADTRQIATLNTELSAAQHSAGDLRKQLAEAQGAAKAAAAPPPVAKTAPIPAPATPATPAK